MLAFLSRDNDTGSVATLRTAIHLLLILTYWQPVIRPRKFFSEPSERNGNQGRSKEGGPGTPNPIPLKLLRIKRVRTRHALRIRLIEL